MTNSEARKLRKKVECLAKDLEGTTKKLKEVEQKCHHTWKSIEGESWDYGHERRVCERCGKNEVVISQESVPIDFNKIFR